MPKYIEEPEAKQDSLAPPEEEPEAPACHDAPREATECPQCQGVMRLWAGFFRCPNCGYKESCCF
jgi:hypothetical protein